MGKRLNQTTIKMLENKWFIREEIAQFLQYYCPLMTRTRADFLAIGGLKLVRMDAKLRPKRAFSYRVGDVKKIIL